MTLTINKPTDMDCKEYIAIVMKLFYEMNLVSDLIRTILQIINENPNEKQINPILIFDRYNNWLFCGLYSDTCNCCGSNKITRTNYLESITKRTNHKLYSQINIFPYELYLLQIQHNYNYIRKKNDLVYIFAQINKFNTNNVRIILMKTYFKIYNIKNEEIILKLKESIPPTGNTENLNIIFKAIMSDNFIFGASL